MVLFACPTRAGVCFQIISAPVMQMVAIVYKCAAGISKHIQIVTVVIIVIVITVIVIAMTAVITMKMKVCTT
ncbi:MAG: hypothetical protein ATN35_05925 [Epulopiscium sp. Nele67-Bin004]|nr:MAG: hypothetical protein ATN35_05925 [Epulopiscium sp. Nele67-Bin004]